MTDAIPEVAARNAAAMSALVHGLGALVTDAVISPGSRSTPLVLSLAARLRVHVVLDERAAAFFALGLARTHGRPVILACTSGSAGAHWLPAVIEADRAGIPLLCLTADRPPELHGVGAPQTIPQRDLLRGYVRLAEDPGPPGDPAPFRVLAARALDAATGERPGPVHLNLPFREPLWAPGVDPAPAEPPPVRIARPTPAIPAALLHDLATRLAGVRRGLIVAGPRELSSEADPRYARALCELADALGWPLIAEPISGVGWGETAGRALMRSDALLRTGRLPPAELVLRVGQDPTNRAPYTQLGAATTTILVDPQGSWHDPRCRAGELLALPVVPLLHGLRDHLGPTSADPGWRRSWEEAERAAEAALTPHRALPDWEGALIDALVRRLPDGALLHVASSMPVRDLDTFAAPTARGVTVAANRGANGIDGMIATAAGEAAGWSAGPVVLLCGDLAFLHDLGALNLAATAGVDLLVAVIDNRGGAIFGNLPIAAHPTQFERLFLTPQAGDIAAFARAAGATVREIDGALGLDAALDDLLPVRGLRVLRARVDRDLNQVRRKAALAAVAEALPSVERA